MSDVLPGFLKEVNDSILYNDDGEFVFVVPEYLFTSKCAVVEGEYIMLLGTLQYFRTDKAGKRSKLKRFKYPSVFVTKPYKTESVKKVKLTEYTEEDDYRFLYYKKEDMVIVSTMIPKDVANLELLLNLFSSGHLPTSIPYDKVQEYFSESVKIAGSSFGITMQVIGFILASVYVDKKDFSKPFRLSGNDNMNDYKVLSLSAAPKYISPSVSITSENFNDAVVGAIMSKKRIDSPMEKMLMR